jgi:hypothetical protein
MDLYSIQNSGGEVYGVYDMPGEDALEPSEWEGQLTHELRDVLGINGVWCGTATYDGVECERVVIDLDPLKANNEVVDRVHMTVGYICLASSRAKLEP